LKIEMFVEEGTINIVCTYGSLNLNLASGTKKKVSCITTLRFDVI